MKIPQCRSERWIEQSALSRDTGRFTAHANNDLQRRSLPIRPVSASPAHGRAAHRAARRAAGGGAGPGTAPGGARASLPSRQPRPPRPRSRGSMIVVDSILISYSSYHDHGQGARPRAGRRRRRVAGATAEAAEAGVAAGAGVRNGQAAPARLRGSREQAARLDQPPRSSHRHSVTSTAKDQ
jgi:hypothetical protein